MFIRWSAESDLRNLTNRWSSRLGDRIGPRVQSRKEPWSLVVVGGAAQLYVMTLGDECIAEAL
jgi:hypothetical protein